MENNENKKIKLPLSAFFLVFMLFVFLFFHGSAKIAEGSTNFNVAGYAWSSDFGWISMNCYNNSSCSQNGGFDYGVNINPLTYTHPFNFDGYAWSPNAGWISFTYNNPMAPPDNWKFNTNCKSGYTCDNTTNCTACYNPDNGKIFGWARVVNLGNDGWIYLSATTTSGGVIMPGITVDLTSASGTFSGFGWNGSTLTSEGLGWISFNCNDPGYFNNCATANYFVYLKSHHLPTAINLSAPNWSMYNACPASSTASGIALNAFLDWTFADPDTGSAQNAYRVIINTVNSTTSPMFDSSERFSATNQFHASNTYGILNYKTPYFWWVKVWDNFGFVSHWFQFDTHIATDTLTDNASGNTAAGGTSQTFTTYLHEMPIAYFRHIPATPLAYYPVTSTDVSKYFTTLTPSTPVSCTKVACSWNWYGIDVLTNTTPTASSTVMTFSHTSSSVAQVKMHVTDPDSYTCGTSSTGVTVDLLPSWKEKQTK
jgi:hypothetical protein